MSLFNMSVYAESRWDLNGTEAKDVTSSSLTRVTYEKKKIGPESLKEDRRERKEQSIRGCLKCRDIGEVDGN